MAGTDSREVKANGLYCVVLLHRSKRMFQRQYSGSGVCRSDGAERRSLVNVAITLRRDEPRLSYVMMVMPGGLFNRFADECRLGSRLGLMSRWPSCGLVSAERDGYIKSTGAARDIISTAGVVLDHRKIDSFGKITSQTGTTVDSS